MSTNGKPYDHARPIEIIETPSTDAIDRLITRTRRLLRSTWTTTGLAITCGLFISALLFVTVVDLAMPLSRFLRVVGWLVVFVSGAAALIGGVIVPLLRRMTAVKVAHKIESHMPGIHNRLVSCVELTGESEAATQSPVFHRKLVTEALQRIRGFQPKTVLDLVRLRNAAIFAGGGVAALIVAAIIFGDRMPTALARIVNPLADIPPNSGVVYDVLIDDRNEPGNADILRGEDVKFTVLLRDGEVDPPGGHDPLRLELNVTEEDGERRRVWYDFGQLRDNRVSLTLNEMQTQCSYRVHGGGTWSKQYSIDLLDRPRITSVRNAVHFPEYMRVAKPRVSEEGVIDISGPVESRIQISVGFEGDVSEGQIELLAPSADGEFVVVEKVAMQSSHHSPSDESGAANGTSIADQRRTPGIPPSNSRYPHSESEGYFTFTLQQDGYYRIALRNSLGYANRKMKEGRLTAIPDNPPQVVLSRPTKDIVVTSPMEIPVQVAAFDDFGLEDVSLIIEHSYWGESRKSHPFETAQPPREEDVLFALDLAEQRLRSSDKIECRIEARDTKGQVAVSDSFSVRVANNPDAADRELAELQEQLDAIDSMLESLVREHNRADQIISELAMTAPAEAGDVGVPPLGGDEEEGRPTEAGTPTEDEDIWERAEQERQNNDDDDIWERDEDALEQLAQLEQQNAELAERLAEALREAAERAAEAQLLPTEIAEQIQAAQQAVEPNVQQPLEQLEQMAEQLAEPNANREQAETAERVSDHVQDSLEDLQARLDAIQQAQQESQQDLEQALADFEQELTEQNAEAAARELSELSEFVEELQEDLQEHREEQTELIAQNSAEMSEPALEQLTEQQESLEQQSREDLEEARDLLNSDPIDDLAQENNGRENDESQNPFEMEEDSGMEDLWEDAAEPDHGQGDEDRREDETFDSKSKEPSFKPAIDGSKKGFEEPFGQEQGEPFGEEPGAEAHEEAFGEEAESWEDAFEAAPEEGAAEQGQPHGSEQSEPHGSEPHGSEPSLASRSRSGDTSAAASELSRVPLRDPQAQLAQQQQQNAEQLGSAAESLAADQQTLNELISELSQATSQGQPSAEASQQLGQLMNSPAMQQAMQMHQRMNQMQLPPSMARNASASLAQSQNNPEGARTMSGAVEQIMVELGETDPNAASLLMRMQPHQREDLLQGLRQGGPKGYRKFIRDYFIRLSEAGAR